MLWTVLAATALLQDSTLVYSGRANQIRVDVPRIDTVASIDGNLDDPVWRRAARLAGFSQYQPVDGRPANEPTEVLVWYSPEAIYFGIRARGYMATSCARPHAIATILTAKTRSRSFSTPTCATDRVSLASIRWLQQDGTRSAHSREGQEATGTGGDFGTSTPRGKRRPDPDYFFESQGVSSRRVRRGMRIPFKSVRYQDAAVQTWGLHVLRRVQHSGFQDTWAPAVRANANFLAQSGSLEGLRNLRRGLVLEATPTLTARADRSPTLGNGRDYQRKGELGGDMRWGIRQNLSLNGTINPDFPQVEPTWYRFCSTTLRRFFGKRPSPDGLELFDTQIS